jgi:peptide chain release factor 2
LSLDYDNEFEKEFNVFLSQYDNFVSFLFLNEKFDNNNCFLTISAGSGGLEATDFAKMLARMYLRYLDKSEFSFEIIDEQNEDGGYVKNVTFYIKGKFAYGLLSNEHGIHRLSRVSPFSNGKVHTSFTSVSVIPEINSDINISINKNDIRVDTYRGSGAGGQHRNKTDSAVRITHLSTGIVVTCENERSQHFNKDFALKQLKSKLYLLEEKKIKSQVEKYSEGEQASWGNQIRTYSINDNRVKDHRTKIENSNVECVFNGNIDNFINSNLLSKNVSF